METKELIRMRADQTLHCLLDKIDQICDDAKDDGYLSDEEVRVLYRAWGTIHELALEPCGEKSQP